MNYATAIEHLYALGHELAPKPRESNAPRRKFDLAHMRTLAEELGNPQKSFTSILIAGTNGKGSTSATLASILKSAGHSVGLYTSPHLVRVNERIKTSHEGAPLRDIDDNTFARLYVRVDDAAAKLVQEGKLPHLPSFFEVVTAIAFLAFAEAGVHLAVLEVGLGGTLDATNIVDPILSVITDISLDHTEWLGDTIALIAGEKAGILRENGVMITLPQHADANRALGEVAMAKNVTGINAAEYLPLRSNETPSQNPGNHYTVRVRNEDLAVDSPLAGSHQQRNIALAIATSVALDAKGISISNAAIAEGIRATAWPGRLQRLTLQGRDVLLDVAHNPAGAWTLRSYLSNTFKGPQTLVFSSLADKAVAEMAQILFPLFEEEGSRILLAPMSNPRAASAEQLSLIAEELETKAEVFPDVASAMDAALSGGAGVVVVAGSVFLVGEVQALIDRGEWKA
jgi:dihydrofolate synthase / folylpolyglutamate synthase